MKFGVEAAERICAEPRDYHRLAAFFEKRDYIFVGQAQPVGFLYPYLVLQDEEYVRAFGARKLRVARGGGEVVFIHVGYVREPRKVSKNRLDERIGYVGIARISGGWAQQVFDGIPSGPSEGKVAVQEKRLEVFCGHASRFTICGCGVTRIRFCARVIFALCP